MTIIKPSFLIIIENMCLIPSLYYSCKQTFNKNIKKLINSNKSKWKDQNTCSILQLWIWTGSATKQRNVCTGFVGCHVIFEALFLSNIINNIELTYAYLLAGCATNVPASLSLKGDSEQLSSSSGVPSPSAFTGNSQQDGSRNALENESNIAGL